jgi:hypothetical protein
MLSDERSTAERQRWLRGEAANQNIKAKAQNRTSMTSKSGPSDEPVEVIFLFLHQTLAWIT